MVNNMIVRFFNNTKRLNSTKSAPVQYTEMECFLKENTSFIMPRLKLSLPYKPEFNYFYFENRYYRVTDIVSIANELWEVSGTIDPLTTFRKHIFNTQAFVLYDSTPNTQLPDSRLGVETDCNAFTSVQDMPWSFSSGLGTYLIATTGNSDEMDLITLSEHPGERVGTGVYTIPQNQLKKLGFDLSDWVTNFNTIYSRYNTEKNRINNNFFIPGTDTLDTIKNFISGWALTIENSFEYVTQFFRLFASNILGSSSALSNVKASYWLPFEIPNTALVTPQAHDTTKLALGNYTDIINGLMEVADPVITSVTVSVNIPWQFNDWRNASCTEVMLYIPLIGCINIPSDVVKGNDTIEVKLSLNLYSGALAVEVLCDGAQIGTYGTTCAMPILIGDSNIDTGAIINTLGSAIAKNYVGVGTSALMSFNEMVSSVGGLGGGAGVGLSNQIVCICRVHNTSQEPSVLLPVIGTPTMQLKTLTQGLGYCQTLNAQVNCSSQTGEPDPTQTEIQMINDYLNGGVYLE